MKDDARQRIFVKKLEILFKAFADGKEATFCRLVGVSRTTFRDQREKGILNPSVEQKITNVCVDLNCEAWRTGSEEEFEEHVRRAPRGAAVRARRTDVRIRIGRSREPMTANPSLASIELRAFQPGVGTANIEISLSCSTARSSFGSFSVRFGRIELDCPAAFLADASHKRWTSGESPKKIQSDRGTIEVEFAGVPRAPGWNLMTTAQTIGNVSLDPELLTLEELSPGDEIEARFGTWLADIEDAELNDDGIALLDGKGERVDLAPESLSVKKRRIIAAIRKADLSKNKVDEGGFVVLATHAIGFVQGEE